VFCSWQVVIRRDGMLEKSLGNWKWLMMCDWWRRIQRGKGTAGEVQSAVWRCGCHTLKMSSIKMLVMSRENAWTIALNYRGVHQPSCYFKQTVILNICNLCSL
jgi:hypothetical protein